MVTKKQLRTYSGVNIQWPWSQLILAQKKTIETRTYPLPVKYIGKELVIIETPGKERLFSTRMIGLIIFGNSFEYESELVFYSHTKKHCVTKDSLWAWNIAKPKWGWPILEVRKFSKQIPLQKRTGIKFSSDIKLDTDALF